LSKKCNTHNISKKRIDAALKKLSETGTIEQDVREKNGYSAKPLRSISY